MKKWRILIGLAVCVLLAVSPAACGKMPVDDGVVSVYRGGETFAFSKWQGDELAYAVAPDGEGVSVQYRKLSSTAQNYPLIAEISCDKPFRYVSFQLSGTVDKEVVVTMGEQVIAEAMIGEQHVFLTDTPVIHTFRLKNRMALTALKTVYLNVDPGAFGLAATGTVNIHRSWFSDTVPEGSRYDDVSTQKNYAFASGASWSRCNGWFVDTAWTNIKITPTAAGGVRVRASDNAAAPYASVIQPIEPSQTATTYSLTFSDPNGSLSDVAVLLRGGQRAWVESGQYWDYYEAATAFFNTQSLTANQDGSYTITYDLAAGMQAIGNHIDDDGLMMVVFFETHGNHPDAQSRDGKFELVIETIAYSGAQV